MHYFSISFKVEKKDGSHFRFISGHLWKNKEDALEHARQFASKYADEDETIDYELKKLVVAD